MLFKRMTRACCFWIILVLLAGMSGGCAPQGSTGMPIAGAGRNGSRLEYYQAARSALSHCDTAQDDKCFVIINLFWSAGYGLIADLNSDGKYDEMHRYATEFLTQAEHVRTLFPGGYDGLLDRMLQSQDSMVRKMTGGGRVSTIVHGGFGQCPFL